MERLIAIWSCARERRSRSRDFRRVPKLFGGTFDISLPVYLWLVLVTCRFDALYALSSVKNIRSRLLLVKKLRHLFFGFFFFLSFFHNGNYGPLEGYWSRQVFVSGIISWYLFNTIIIFYRVKEYYFEIRYCNEWSTSLFFWIYIVQV